MANNVTMSFANIVKIKGYYLFHGNILKIKKLRFGKEIDFPTKTAIPVSVSTMTYCIYQKTAKRRA